MYCMVVLTLAFCLVGVFSLECVFDAESAAVQLNVHGGVDTCESSDVYCVKLNNVNGIYAKGCSKTAQKITEQSLQVSCAEEKCNADGSLCCCKGNMCNGSAGASVVMSLLTMAAARAFLNN